MSFSHSPAKFSAFPGGMERLEVLLINAEQVETGPLVCALKQASGLREVEVRCTQSVAEVAADALASTHLVLCVLSGRWEEEKPQELGDLPGGTPVFVLWETGVGCWGLRPLNAGRGELWRQCPAQDSCTASGLLWLASQHQEQQALRSTLHQLQTSNDRYRTLLQSIPAGVFRATLSGRILDCNPAFAEILGYLSSEDALRDATNPLGPAGGEPFPAFARLQHDGKASNVEFLTQRRDGSPLRLLANFTLVPEDAGGAALIEGALLDITERHTLEQQLQQSQKMEAIGRFAGGLAHDFNNLLMVICSYAEMLLDGSDPHSNAHHQTLEILKAGRRAADLTRELLTFSRRQPQPLHALDLNSVLRDSARLIARLIGEDIELDLRPAPDLWPAKADPTQIEQVLLNLASNARDAMPRGGKLTLETRNLAADLDRPELAPGDYVLFTLSDTGDGIAPSVLPRIFEPFFTTKEEGKGTGLGLAMVYKIIQGMDGSVCARSEQGCGTTFEICLPRAAASRATVGECAPRRGIPRGSETILLVEDNSAVREALRIVLISSGYTVLAAENSVAALRSALEHPGTIHLLVTDVILPCMNVIDLLQSLRLTRPQLKVLYISGHEHSTLMQTHQLSAESHFLRKPFSLQLFSWKVRDIFSEPALLAAAASASVT